MYNEHAEIICTNFAQALEKYSGKHLGTNMLKRFFLRYPEALTIFKGVDTGDFAASKFRIIKEHIIDCVQRPEHATYNMFCEIHRHCYLDIRDVDYHYALIDTCREAVEEALADEWTAEINEHWNDVVQASKFVVQQAWAEADDGSLSL